MLFKLENAFSMTVPFLYPKIVYNFTTNQSNDVGNQVTLYDVHLCVVWVALMDVLNSHLMI